MLLYATRPYRDWNYACFGLATLHTLPYQRSEKLHGPFVLAAVLSMA